MKMKFPFLVSVFFSVTATVSAAYISDVNNSMFADVDLKHENFNAIYYLKNTGIINGYESKNSKIPDYRPNDKINRAEFLKIVLEGTGIVTDENSKSCFPDVKKGEWYTKYVCKAKEEGWVGGYGDGKFRPEQTINEAESLKILGEVLGWKKAELSEDEKWYEAYLKPAEEKKIVPKENVNADMSRGDIAELIFRNTMVTDLAVPYYDPKWEPNLFAIEEIPLEGPMGPGGIFGPDGPMGPSGAFVDDGAFDSEKGEATLVPESYFKNNYCYFSDDGEFSGDNLDFLQGYTKSDLDKYVSGSILDEFGKMFCYTGIATTDLTYFDQKMREEFDILCWTRPDFPTKETKGWDELLCWAREKDHPKVIADYADEIDNEPSCYLPPDGKKTIGSDKEPPDAVEVNENMHLVIPITQKDQTCAAAAAYSSLRWLEEKLGVELVENGQDGYDALIKLLYKDTWTLEGQYKIFKKYIEGNFPGCLSANYHTIGWGFGDNISCEELKINYDKGCDIPLGLRCTEPGDWFSWGHRVDIVDVQIDPENPNKCQIIFANSQTPDAGETAGPDDPDGLGYGSYQRGDYNDQKNKFDIKAPWAKGKPCTIYGAQYVCVEDEKICKDPTLYTPPPNPNNIFPGLEVLQEP